MKYLDLKTCDSKTVDGIQQIYFKASRNSYLIEHLQMDHIRHTFSAGMPANGQRTRSNALPLDKNIY